jgi:UDP-4-amino-4,6-dideoxy-N-acetyl-beta-L-altrosamine transaminase
MTAPNTKFLPYGRQNIDDDDIAAVVAVLRSDFLTSGPIVEAFEAKLCQLTGAPETVSCSSATAALHMAALALDLKPGDWAVVPAITFLATANAIRYTGADVIFADVDPNSGLMTAATFQAALNANSDKNIRAVLPVHLAGQPADPISIASIARGKGIAVIEDASHALGTSYSEDESKEPHKVGSCTHSDMTVFSFHPVKVIACGEGGAVTTRNPTLAKRLRLFRNHGMTRFSEDFTNLELSSDASGVINSWYYEMAEPGFNYRLSDIHAALGLSQLSKLPSFTKKRRKIVAQYDKLLDGLNPNISLLSKVLDCIVGWHLYPVLINFANLGKERRVVMDALREAGIGTQVHYIPVSSQPYYQNRYGKQDLPGVEAYYTRTLSLPLFPTLTKRDVERVVQKLDHIIGHAL